MCTQLRFCVRVATRLHGNGANYYYKTQGTPTGFPHVFSVPQGRQEFLISQET